jgi:hypothetical protein
MEVDDGEEVGEEERRREREGGRKGRQGRANTFVARSECSARLGLGLAGLLQPAWQLSISKASIVIEANRSLTGSLPCSLLHTSDVDEVSNCSCMRCVLYLCRTSIWKRQYLSGLLLEEWR